jgi:transitional endoplasmic reticulum ATPase
MAQSRTGEEGLAPTADADAPAVAIADEWCEAAKSIRPSGLLGLLTGDSACAPDTHAPAVMWRDVRGHRTVKQRLEQLVLWPLRHPQSAARLGLGGASGILLYGPPGTGKTLLVRALATESGLNLLAVPLTQLVVSEVGGSERAIARLFERARAYAPCILLLDEMQAVFGRRAGGGTEGAHEGGGQGVGVTGRQMLSQLLLELDELQAARTPSTSVVIIGVTNTPEAIDQALLRPGRLEHQLFMPPPSCSARAHIFRPTLHGLPSVTGAAHPALSRPAYASHRCRPAP